MAKDEEEIRGYIEFPCHPRVKVAVYEGSHGRIQCCCRLCKTFVVFDVDSMTSKIARPVRGLARRNNYLTARQSLRG